MADKKLTSDTIKNALAWKHVEDVCVSECKTGPSNYGSKKLGIMDFWVMPKSWAHPAITAYEVKVHRSDFLNDEKWRGYLPYCNYLYFCTPKDLVQPEELPAEVGLCYCSATGTKIYTKRKAVYRDVIIPESIFRYILMARCRIDDDQSSAQARLRQWVQTREYEQIEGHLHSKAIRKCIDEQINKVQAENRTLRRKHEEYELIKQQITSLGLSADDIANWTVSREVGSRLRDIKRGHSLEIVNTINNLVRALSEFRREIELDKGEI